MLTRAPYPALLALALGACGDGERSSNAEPEATTPACLDTESGSVVWIADGVQTEDGNCGVAGGDLMARYSRELQLLCTDGLGRATGESRRGPLVSFEGACCEPGLTHFDGESCVPNERACALPSEWSNDAVGIQRWADGAWGGCDFDRCPEGRHLEEQTCVPSERSCSLPVGAGAQVWLGEAWGPCLAGTCPSGFHLENGACARDVQACLVENGIGERTWNGSAYGACLATRCDVGFQILNDVCVDEFSPREQLVWNTYVYFFGRTPTDLALTFWSGQSGPSDAQLIADILSGASQPDRERVLANRRIEARDHYLVNNLGPGEWLLLGQERIVVRCHSLYYGRQVQPGELDFWLQQQPGDDIALEAVIIIAAEGDDRATLLASSADAARQFLTDNGYGIPGWLL